VSRQERILDSLVFFFSIKILGRTLSHSHLCAGALDISFLHGSMTGKSMIQLLHLA